MTVKDVTRLICHTTRFRLVGAMTGKTLYNSRTNRKELLEKYENCEVTDTPIWAELCCDYDGITHGYECAYPMIAIWVMGK